MKPKTGKNDSLNGEARRLATLIKGLTVTRVRRFSRGELLLEFSDKTRLYVNVRDDGLDLSVT